VNTLATSLLNRVNVQHRKGFGLDGILGRPFFCDTCTATLQGTLSLPTGTTEDTTLDLLGISAGDFIVQGKTITIAQEDITPGEAITVGELLDRITDSQPYIRATLETSVLGDRYVRFSLYNPEQKNDVISTISGSSNFLHVVGMADAQTQFTNANETYTNSADIFSVALTVIEDLDTIAAAGNDGSGIYPGPGNNDNALAIAALQYMLEAVEGTTFTDYYASTVSELGSQAQTATNLVSNQDVLLNQLEVQRESVRGVSLDEEATFMIIYQRIYEGAARVTQVIDSMLDTLINRTGA
jgi:flagellar hook-associated protein FlgK